MPSADFCPAVRLPLDSLSPLRTQNRSPGVISAAFRAQSPDLRFASLMDMDFAVSCPLVRRSRLISGICPSTRTFAPRFLQTSPHDDSPCVITSPSPPSGWAEDFHLQTAEHAQHTTKPQAGRASFVMWSQGKEFSCDPTSTTNAGGSPDSSLLIHHHPDLPACHRRVRSALLQITRSARFRAHSLLSA